MKDAFGPGDSDAGTVRQFADETLLLPQLHCDNSEEPQQSTVKLQLCEFISVPYIFVK